MSSFTESGLVKKLLELNPSQQSIQTLSLWLIHHRKHHSIIVKTWIKELQKGKREIAVPEHNLESVFSLFCSRDIQETHVHVSCERRYPK